MSKFHAKDPSPYSKAYATEKSRIILVAALTANMMERFRTKDEVEFLLDNLDYVSKKIDEASSLFLEDKVLYWRFLIKKFYKTLGQSVNADFMFPKQVEDGLYYMRIESEMDTELFLSHAQMALGVRFPNLLHEECRYNPKGMLKSTSYTFAFRKKCQQPDKEWQELTCLEYIMCQLFLKWYEEYFFDRNGSTTIIKSRVHDDTFIIFSSEDKNIKIDIQTADKVTDELIKKASPKTKKILFP